MDRREMLAAIGVGLPYSAALAYGIDALPKPYDPVAVLEAMREREHHFSLRHVACTGYEVAYGWQFGKTHPKWKMDFPDFPSAVRWLHEQAAAADAEFAARWPVPSDLTNEQLDAVAEHLRATGQAKS